MQSIRHRRAARALLAVYLSSLLAVPSLGRIDPVAPLASLDRLAAAPVAPGASPSSVDRAAAHASGVSPRALDLALGAVACATASGAIAAPATLTLIDYSLPSIVPRLWVFDMASGATLYRELVAHGRNSGEARSTLFSDAAQSRRSSLGLFVAGETYVGANGYSLRLDGLEPGFNGRARERAIVMHGAWYVDPDLAARQGRIGRSWGCPALRPAVTRELIDTVRGGGAVFAYYPDANWLKHSRFLNGCTGSATKTAAVH